MAIAGEAKTKLIEDFRRHDTDSGSPEVQIAVLTTRIIELTEHLRTHKHDYASRRGLLMLVGKRNRLLRYLMRTNRDSYQALIKRLGLRKYFADFFFMSPRMRAAVGKPHSSRPP